jgi:hypothetical protein
MLTILFAIILASIAGVSSAQSPQTLQYDGATAGTANSIQPNPNAVFDPFRVAGGAVHGNRSRADARPVYAQLDASLANFDADADPDGWRAEVVLRDQKDRPVVMRAHATFELMPRVPMADHHRFVDADATPVRWSMPLEFDEDSVARVKLPLRRSLRPMLGWSSAVYPPSGIRTRNAGNTAHGLRTWKRSRTFVTSDLRTLVGTPASGELRVRVSVPTEGVFAAATGVWIRPSVLVDTKWPYR